MVVLLEEELVVMDLRTPGWPSLPTPYLAPLHSSAITCSFHVSGVPPKLWERLANAGRAQQGRQPAHGVRGARGRLARARSDLIFSSARWNRNPAASTRVSAATSSDPA